MQHHAVLSTHGGRGSLSLCSTHRHSRLTSLILLQEASHTCDQNSYLYRFPQASCAISYIHPSVPKFFLKTCFLGVRKRSQILGTLTYFSLHIHVFKQTVVWCGVHEPVDLANASRLSSPDPDVRGFLRKRSAHTCANVRTTEQKLKRKAGNVTLSDPSSLSFLRRQKERAFAVPPAVVSLPSSGFAITPHTHAQYSHPGSSHERSETTTDARSGHKPRPNRDFFFLIPTTSIASRAGESRFPSPPDHLDRAPLPHFDAVTPSNPQSTRAGASGLRAPGRLGARPRVAGCGPSPIGKSGASKLGAPSGSTTAAWIVSGAAKRAACAAARAAGVYRAVRRCKLHACNASSKRDEEGGSVQ